MGSLIISLPMFLITILFHGGFGGGDIKLVFSYGMFLGTDRILMACMTGCVMAVFHALGKRCFYKADWKEIPLGLFLAAGIFITAFFP